MTFPIIIDEWEKNSRERVRVAIDSYRGNTLIDLRAFWPDGDQWKPGKGLSCRLSQLPRLLDALNNAIETARERGLLDEERP